jgi:hypothetical protein
MIYFNCKINYSMILTGFFRNLSNLNDIILLNNIKTEFYCKLYINKYEDIRNSIIFYTRKSME